MYLETQFDVMIQITVTFLLAAAEKGGLKNEVNNAWFTILCLRLTASWLSSAIFFDAYGERLEANQHHQHLRTKIFYLDGQRLLVWA